MFDIEFYKSDTEDIFIKKYKELLKLGMSKEDAKEFLEEIYTAVGGEYGE